MKRLLLLMTFLFGMEILQSCSDHTLIDDEIEQQEIRAIYKEDAPTPRQ